MQERHIHFYSHIIGRSLDLYVTGHWGQPILMFPTSMGSAHQNRDMGILGSIHNYINDRKIKTYNIASIDFETFYVCLLLIFAILSTMCYLSQQTISISHD